MYIERYYFMNHDGECFYHPTNYARWTFFLSYDIMSTSIVHIYLQITYSFVYREILFHESWWWVFLSPNKLCMRSSTIYVWDARQSPMHEMNGSRLSLMGLLLPIIYNINNWMSCILMYNDGLHSYSFYTTTLLLYHICLCCWKVTKNSTSGKFSSLVIESTWLLETLHIYLVDVTLWE